MRILFLGLCACVLAAAGPPEAQREAASTTNMRVHVVRLRPGDDLLTSLLDYVKRREIRSAVVLTSVGSLKEARLRLADRPAATAFPGKHEIVSMVGTIDDGSAAHLHVSISDRRGRTIGGHLMPGCRIYTTAEIAIGELPGLRFSRETDPVSGYDELKIDPVTR